jgi:hypothetical protein
MQAYLLATLKFMRVIVLQILSKWQACPCPGVVGNLYSNQLLDAPLQISREGSWFVDPYGAIDATMHHNDCTTLYLRIREFTKVERRPSKTFFNNIA